MKARLWIGCVLALVSACATTARPGAAHEASTPTAPRLPPADYGTRATPGWLVADAPEPLLEQTLADACRLSSLLPDGRLAQLALAVAHSHGTQQSAPQATMVGYYARRVGLTDPTPQLWLAAASNVELLRAPLRDAVLHAAKAEPLTHCGAGVLHASGLVVMAVAFSRRQVELTGTLPRTLPLHGKLTLQGELARGHDDATLAVTPPEGVVQRIALPRGRKLRHTLQLSQRGEHMIELLAVGPSGVTVVAMFPVTVGQAESDEAPRVQTLLPEASPAQVTEVLFALISEERARRKLPPLRMERKLAAVALAHSTDMLEHHFIAHTSPRTGEAIDRVDKTGLEVSLLLENIGRGYSASEIHAGLMESPGHRANILNPDVRLIGIGVVAEPEGSRQAFLATQVFAQLMEPAQPQPRRRKQTKP